MVIIITKYVTIIPSPFKNVRGLCFKSVISCRFIIPLTMKTVKAKPDEKSMLVNVSEYKKETNG
jgi:hypothetical protein